MHYEVSEQDQEQLRNRYTYHAPFGDQAKRYEAVRMEGWRLARFILSACPPGRERAMAETHIDEAIMCANAAIARGETNSAVSIHAFETPDAIFQADISTAQVVDPAVVPLTEGGTAVGA